MITTEQVDFVLNLQNLEYCKAVNTRLVSFELVLLLIFAGATSAGAQVFEAGECPFEHAENVDGVSCGYLKVPEDRSKPDGRMLRLAVAVVESLAENPSSSPLVFLTGGPGGGSVQYVPARLKSEFWNRLREDRDLIFFDQRGTGYSEPEFCPELDVAIYTSAFEGLTLEQQIQHDLVAVEACRDSMLKDGIDFAHYNTTTNARDLSDIRVALGIEEWNVFGLSYGTRLALVTLRVAPEGVRSVVLDSLYPPNAPRATRRQNFARALRLAFDRCANDPRCNEAFPTLETDFYSMLTEFDASPINIPMSDTRRFPNGHIVIDGSVIAAGIYQGFYSGRFVELFPLLVRETHARNSDLLRSLADSLVRDPHRMRRGLNLSIQCNEAVGRTTQAMLDADRAAHPELDIWRGSENRLAHCNAWHQHRAGDDFSEPVSSEVPTLLFAGEVDPISPPSFARLANETLVNGLVVEIPGEGHSVAPTSECATDIILRFIADPSSPLDTTCLSELPEPRYITEVHMTPGVSRVMASIQGSGLPVPLVLTAASLVVLLSALVVWPVQWLWQRLRRNRIEQTNFPGYARWFAVGTALLAVAFVIALALAVRDTLAVNPLVLAFGVPTDRSWIFTLPWLALFTTAGAALSAVYSWRSGWWSKPARTHYTLVAAAGLGFVVSLKVQGFI